MVPQKQHRPLVLMHVCNDCALFSVRRQKPNANNGLRQTLIVAAPFCSTNENESDSSPFSSPASSADGSVISSSPETSELSSPKPAHVRHRSHSECGEMSPIKSILKRRPIFRSLSECAEENYDMMKYYGQSLEDVSESDSRYFDDGVAGSPPSLNGFKKKSVSFSERVEENFFRPNSSILGQRKKNQRKNKSRKRRESTDSMLSSEENEDENRNKVKKTNDNSSLVDGFVSIENNAATNNNNDDKNTQTAAAVVNEPPIPSGDAAGAEPHPPLFTCGPASETPSETRKNKNSKTSKKKCKDRKTANNATNPVLSDNRYKGFVIGVQQQQRRPSTDSAFSTSGTDEDDNENDNDFVIIGGGDNNSIGGIMNDRRHSSLEMKDSGIDDEMEELCVQMTAAIVSA